MKQHPCPPCSLPSLSDALQLCLFQQQGGQDSLGEPIYTAVFEGLKWEHVSCVPGHTCSHTQLCEALWVVFVEEKMLAKVPLALPA